MDESRLALKYKKKIVGFYILSISMLALWLGLTLIFAFWVLSLADKSGMNVGRYFILAFLPIVFSLFAVMAFLIYRPAKPKGYVVTKADAPALCKLINDTAIRVGYKGKIDEVLLTPGMSVSVYFEPSLKHFFTDESCKLYIGIGLCRYLSRTELQAVIGHELAHFTQPQTKYKAYLARMANTSLILGKRGIVGQSMKPAVFSVYVLPARFMNWIFNSMFEQILDVNSAEYLELSNDMELDADRTSADAFGKDNMLSALCKSVSLNARLGIYKNLILPYIASDGYRIRSFWKSFDACSNFLGKIDGLEIVPEQKLRNCNRTHFDLSEMSLPLRLDVLMKEIGQNPGNNTDENALLLFPSPINLMMDCWLTNKYVKSDCVYITETRLDELLGELRDGIFADVSSIEDAYAIMNEIMELSKTDENIMPPKIMSEYESPSCDVLPQSSVISPTELIYSSGNDKCPVCGHNVAEDTKICPHCHEIISE